jgi:hypothetical protein
LAPEGRPALAWQNARIPGGVRRLSNLIEAFRTMAKKKDNGLRLSRRMIVQLANIKRLLDRVRILHELGLDGLIEVLQAFREKLTPEQKQILKELSS